MSYINQYHYTLRNQPFMGLNGALVLLADPEAESRSFYGKQLEDIGMRVYLLDQVANLVNMARSHSPDVVIVNPSADISASSRTIAALRQEFTNLPVITMTMTIPEDTLDAMMKAGVSLHINRGLTQPRDLLLALEQLIPKK